MKSKDLVCRSLGQMLEMCEDLEFEERPPYDELVEILGDINLERAEKFSPNFDWTEHYETILQKEEQSWEDFINNNIL